MASMPCERGSTGTVWRKRVAWVLQVQVAPHPRLRRKGADILSTLELRLSEALLGCSKMVETAWGQSSVRVPPGTEVRCLLCLLAKSERLVLPHAHGPCSACAMCGV